MKAALLIVSLAVAGLGAAWYYSGTAATPPAWRTAQVTRGGIQSAVLATGTLKAVVTVQVGSEISGRIVALEADFNTPVTRGQVIARLDPATYRARLSQATADFTVAEATVRMRDAALERARTQLKTAQLSAADAERTLGRTEQLGKGGIVTEKQLQTDRLALAQARVAVDSAQAQIRMSEAELAVAQAQAQQKRAAVSIAETDLERTVIRSPVDGTVVNRQIDVGQTVAASLQAPILFEIAQNLNEMRLEASVDEADIGRIRQGLAATFTVDAYPGRSFEGKVSQVRMAPKLVQNVTTYTVVIASSNPALELLPGMTANVRVIEAERENALKVPAAALRFDPTGAAPSGSRRRGAQPGAGEVAVHVARPDGEAVRVPVEAGLAGEAEVEVVAGLSEGQQVIIGRAEGPGRRRPRGPFGL